MHRQSPYSVSATVDGSGTAGDLAKASNKKQETYVFLDVGHAPELCEMFKNCEEFNCRMLFPV